MLKTLTMIAVLLAVLASVAQAESWREVACEGTYKHHLQGIARDEQSIYWSFTTTLVKTDAAGRVLLSVPVANHHGDLCVADGKVYVAVNLGKFNQPDGNADSWVYVYDAATLQELARREVQEVFHGAGAIGIQDGRFFVAGGLPEGIEENYVYEYDRDFQFVKKHAIASGQTKLGIQTATFEQGRWYFGCYGSPAALLITDENFRMIGRYDYNCSLGIVGLADGRFLSATGKCDKEQGCSGVARIAVPDAKTGLTLVKQ